MKRLTAVFDGVTTALAWASGAAFVLLSIHITVTVLGRYFGLFFVQGTDDLSALVLAFGSTAGLAYALRVEAHVRVDVLFSALPKTVQNALSTVSLALMALFAGLLAVYGWRLALESLSLGTRSVSIVQMPIWVPQILVAIGFSMLALQAIVSMIALLAAQIAARREG